MSEIREAVASLELTEQGIPLVVPVVEVTLYFDIVQPDVLKGVTETLLSQLDTQLTHFSTATMKGFAPRNAKCADALETFFDRPREGALKRMQLRDVKQGAGSSALDIFFVYHAPIPEEPAALQAFVAAQVERYEVIQSTAMPMVTSIRGTFPLDHPMADPETLLQWILGLDAVKNVEFVSGHAGYGLNVFETAGAIDLQNAMFARQASALLRHPGLDWERYGDIGNQLLKYRPDHPWFWPSIKRAQWLTLVRTDMLDGLCGGRATVETAVCGQDGVVCHDLGPDGLVFQAGAVPDIGDLPEGQDLPAYRRVAQALAAARLPTHKGTGNPFNSERAQAWLEAFERDHD